MSWGISRRSGVLAVVAVGSMALAACSSSSGGSPVVSGVVPPSATASTSPSPSETPEVQRSLLSGRVGMKDGQVLVVKMDNTTATPTHAGLEDADVVYIEQVEGGLSRYAAVYSTKVPKVLGPIRSARIADLELLRQYGKVAFAFSGSSPKMRPVIARADIYDVSGDRGATGYWRQPGRYPPYNFFGNGKTLLKRAPHAVKAHDVGFTFDDAVPAGGTALKSVTARWPAAKAQFTWSNDKQRWLLTMDNRPARSVTGAQLGGTTVIVQYVHVYPSGYGITPMSNTVGSGKAVFLRNGRAYKGTWSRPSAVHGTTWKVKGQEFPLAGGQVWVLLVNRDSPVQQVKR